MKKLRLVAQLIGTLLWAVASEAALAQSIDGADENLRSAIVLEIELQDDQNNPLTKAAQVERLSKSLLQLRRELTERHLYKVVGQLSGAQEVDQKLRSQQEYIYRCDDCAVQIGRAASVDLVITPWIQKVSELILNFNIQIVDVARERVVFTKSVDMRGNDDESWSRAVRYLVRDMAEKRAINANYAN